MNEMYQSFVLKNIYKVLSQIDRNKSSLTYGSCDRNYWHLKIRDFSSAILQQTSLTLALLYKNDFKGNIYYNNNMIKKTSIASLSYLTKIQLKDGSFNEYYPHEHSFPATAFTLYTSAKTYDILNLSDSKLLAMMKKSAYYLADKIEPLAYNQEIASIAGLYQYFKISKDDNILKSADKKLKRILSLQNIEGWFLEYDGADIGYLSVTLDMLMEIYDLTLNNDVLDAASKIVEFIKYFCHSDNSIGGEYGSRNTMYFLPYGLQCLANKNNKTALAILDHIIKDTDNINYFLNSVDDRYFTHYLMHSFLRSLDIYKENDKEIIPLPYQLIHYKVFKESLLVSFKNNCYNAIIGMNKGGIIKVFNSNNEVFSDFGYIINIDKNTSATSYWQNLNNKFIISDNKIEVECFFRTIKKIKMTPIKHFILRISSYLLGSKIIKYLKKRIILPNKDTNIKLNRQIILESNNIKIIDNISSNKPIYNLEKSSCLSLRHVASDKFFKTTELLDLEQLKYIPGKNNYQFIYEFEVRGE